jgi:DNA-binding response OmpR family regulator
MQESGELVRHIPVIAVTANAREEQIKETLNSGIDDVMSKPFRIPELVPKMRDVVGRFAPPARSEIWNG